MLMANNISYLMGAFCNAGDRFKAISVKPPQGLFSLLEAFVFAGQAELQTFFIIL